MEVTSPKSRVMETDPLDLGAINRVVVVSIYSGKRHMGDPDIQPQLRTASIRDYTTILLSKLVLGTFMQWLITGQKTIAWYFSGSESINLGNRTNSTFNLLASL